MAGRLLALALSLAPLGPAVPGRVVQQQAGAPAPATQLRAALRGTAVLDTSGAPVDPLDPALAAPRLLVFTSIDCPIARRYAPELARLADSCAQAGIRFWLVYPDADALPASIEEHEREFGLDAASVLDPEHALVSAARATVTPEAALFGATGELVYHGRIDDRAVDLGVWRADAGRSELREAMLALLAGQPSRAPFAPAVGCPIGSPRFEPRSGAPASYEPEIREILAAHCTACHARDGMAPFPLSSCADAAERGALILEVIERRIMPPWKALPCDVDFLDENRVTPRELEALRRWVAGGAPCAQQEPVQEAPGSAPPAGEPRWPDEAPGRTLVAQLPEPWELAAEGRDITRTFALPLAAERDCWVRGLVVEPLNRQPMHHAILYLDPPGSPVAARAHDGRDPAPGLEDLIDLALEPGCERGGWSPGVVARPHPAGTGWFLPAGSALLLDVHLVPTGRRESIDMDVRLWVTDEPPERALQLQWLGIGGINLAAGEREWQGHDAIVLPVDLELTGLIPHAHQVCRRVTVDAQLPDGRRLRLLSIDDWDFAWQMQYRLTRPLALPAGTRVETTFTYDNSSANPRNPSAPPRRVVGGVLSRDEMGALWLEVSVPRGEAERALAAANLEHLRQGRADLPLQELRRHAISRFDGDANGSLDEEEDRRLVAWMGGLTLESPEVLEARAVFDADRSGSLDESETGRLRSFLAEWRTVPVEARASGAADARAR